MLGTAVLMLVWIGGTAFDGFTYRPFWQDVLGTSTGWTRTLLNTVGLLWITAIVAGGFLAVVRVAERGQREEDRDRRLFEPLGRALVPLAVGWFLGHDLTLLLGEGQNAYALASDPLGRGWDLFGTYDHTIDYSIVTRAVGAVDAARAHRRRATSPTVVLLHELAMERLSPRAAMRTTWAMAVLGQPVDHRGLPAGAHVRRWDVRDRHRCVARSPTRAGGTSCSSCWCRSGCSAGSSPSPTAEPPPTRPSATPTPTTTE